MPETPLAAAVVEVGPNIEGDVRRWLRATIRAVQHREDGQYVSVVLLSLLDALGHPDRRDHPRLLQAVALLDRRTVTVWGDSALDIAHSLIRSGATSEEPSFPVIRELALLLDRVMREVRAAEATFAEELEAL